MGDDRVTEGLAGRDLPAPTGRWPADWDTLREAVGLRQRYAALRGLIAVERSLCTELGIPPRPWSALDQSVANDLAPVVATTSEAVPATELLALSDVIGQRTDVACARIAAMRQALELIAGGQASLDAARLEAARSALEQAHSLVPDSQVVAGLLARCRQAIEDARAAFAAHACSLTDSQSAPAIEAQVQLVAGALAQARSLMGQGKMQTALDRLRDLATEFPGLPGLQPELDRMRGALEAVPDEVVSRLEHPRETESTGESAEPASVANRPDAASSRLPLPVVPALPVAVTRAWRKAVVLGISGLAILTSPVWLPAMMSLIRRPPPNVPGHAVGADPGRDLSGQTATRGTGPNRATTSLLGRADAGDAGLAFPARRLDLVGVMKDGTTYRDPEGRFQFDYPARTWNASAGIAPVLVQVVDEAGGAAIRVELRDAGDPRDPDRLLRDELARIRSDGAAAEDILVRPTRPALPMVVIDYRRSTGSGWEQVRHYLQTGGRPPFCLVATAPASRFTLVEGVFNLVAKSFESSSK